ncbi:MAG: ATP-dependent protease ATPase subunit HslU, partial [Alphaproteobacteria bacterium]
WRRLNIKDEGLRDDIIPKNILMIGPTGCGKTEIARKLAKLTNSPLYIKVEATKFTEIGYVGRDVEQIIRDLIEVAINLEKKKVRDRFIGEAKINAEEIVLKSLLGDNPSDETKEKFRSMLRDNQLNDKEVEIALDEKSNPFQSLDIPGMPGAQMGMINMNDIFGKGLKNKKKTKLKIGDAYEPLIQEEIEKIAEKQNVIQNAIKSVQESGIVFIDEIDKIAPNSERRGGDVSREGVQRDLLPLIEGTVVTTKYGTIETNHILFIASGAFHQSKPSDLLPELQGRLPVRVRLNALTKNDFIRILKETDNSLTKQYKSLFATENIELQFEDDALEEIANLTEQINTEVENIGARRLQTMFEKILERISFEANLSDNKIEVVNKAWVNDAVKSEIKPTDEKKFIL